MKLIDRDAYRKELEKAADRNMSIKPNPVVLMVLRYAIGKLDSAPVVEAIPVEWIKKHISEIGDNSTIAEAYNLLIEIWRAEQEEQNETI